MARGHRGNGGRLRGIHRNDGAELLEAIPESFEQLAHRLKDIVIKQRSHPLPQHALAAQLHPHRLEQGATQLLGLVHQERQHHQHGKHLREMLLAMPVVVLKVIALVFQRNELPRSKLRGIKPPLAYSHGPASLAGWMLVYLVYVLHANLRTTPTGRLGDAVAYSLFHCPAAEHTGE